MYRSSFASWTIFLMMIGTTAARAAEWISPDGKIAFLEPRPARFQKDQTVPSPGLVRWVSSDGLTKLVVVETAYPSDVPLEKSGLEEGTLDQFTQGKLISSAQTLVSGIPVYTIVASGNISGLPLYVAQVVVAFDGQVYKFIVESTNDPALDSDVGPILWSLRILEPAPRPPEGHQKMSEHEISRLVGEWGCMSIFAALLVVFLRRILRKKT